ncbi:hypothetical protein H8356DRAFT_1431295 [Neocallimastix lanati (nom. inval.)]|nr:hypothetical protein H8356DRAFT_1431295 [Neocallimastix sp. JGI-2020a]
MILNSIPWASIYKAPGSIPSYDPYPGFYGTWWPGLQTGYCPNCGYILLGDVDILLNCNLSDVYAITKRASTYFHENWRSTLKKCCPKGSILPIGRYCDYLNVPVNGHESIKS